MVAPRQPVDSVYAPGTVAGTSLSAARALRFTGPTTVGYADAATLAHSGQAVGLSTHAASAGAAVQMILSGLLEDDGWSWTVGGVVFVGLNGVLTQTHSAAWAFTHPVGWAVSANGIYVLIGPAIIH